MRDNIIVVRNIDDYYQNVNDNILKESVVVYCRVSSKGQIDNNSLPKQQSDGIRYFSNSKIKYNTIIVFREEGKSGDDYNVESIVERELLQIVLSKIDKGYIKHFWIMDESRLSRNLEVSYIIQNRLIENDVNFYIGHSKKDINDLSQTMVFKVISLFNEFENLQKFQKCLWGKIESVKKGKHFGGKYPFGFKKGKDGRYDINKEQKKYVLDIFNMFSNGKSLNDIIIYLNEQNVKPPKSNCTVWNDGTLRNMLRSQLYIGKQKWEIRTLKGKSKEYCRSKNKLIVIEQTLPKIVSDDLYYNVQKKLETQQSKIQSKIKVKYNYLLNHLMYCGNCGNKLKVRNNPKQNIKLYWCNYVEKSFRDYNNELIECGREYNKSINVDVTDTLVWNELLLTFKNSYIIKEEFKKKYLSKIYDERKRPKTQIEKYNQLIKTHQSQIRKLKNSRIELFERKIELEMTDSTYIRLERNLNTKINKLNEKISDTTIEIQNINKSIQWYDWFEDFETHYNTIKNYKTIDERKSFINKFVEKIDVNYDHISKTHTLNIYFKIGIVKDKRERLEKYVFDIKSGKKLSTISTINSNKISRIINKEKKQNTSLQTYSTVTDLFQNTSLYTKNSNVNSVKQINVSFDLIITSSKLTKTSHYNSYQQKLYRLIKFLKEERNIGYRRISNILFEKGFRSIRTNSVLENNYIYSIYKKGKIREDRINRSFETKINNTHYSISNL